jgi:hypothetical protein
MATLPSSAIALLNGFQPRHKVPHDPELTAGADKKNREQLFSFGLPNKDMDYP